ncbi:unnamed protein product [Cuscuta campestris]|uniref:cytokinin riboside 5'-monophosphate phosphoribohydrolase n=1 Tax=Cuscuta campestris TaxID=132261 RepID=A0A484K8B7_9ASTE|nr:unnamed protein product [Cuscuta campestris]
MSSSSSSSGTLHFSPNIIVFFHIESSCFSFFSRFFSFPASPPTLMLMLDVSVAFLCVIEACELDLKWYDAARFAAGGIGSRWRSSSGAFGEASSGARGELGLVSRSLLFSVSTSVVVALHCLRRFSFLRLKKPQRTVTMVMVVAIENKRKTNNNNFKKICVFCGSNSGYRKVFSDAALELGNELVNRKIDLVYGGGSVGLMGLISKAVYDGGCHVLGVIPQALVPVEISGESVGDVKIVADMHERKAEMAREADAFVALPGGYGTMEELLEMITWAQLGIHKKPVGLLNVDGYYNPLLALFDNGVEEGFIKATARHIVLSAPNASALLNNMENSSFLFYELANCHEK